MNDLYQFIICKCHKQVQQSSNKLIPQQACVVCVCVHVASEKNKREDVTDQSRHLTQ